MGDIADEHISRFASGAWGTRIHEPKVYPKTTKAAIAHQLFKIVMTLDGQQGHPAVQTNRIPGTRLIVCDNSENEEAYWVWASQGVTGIHKGCCKALREGLTIHEALAALGRKPWAADRTAEVAQPLVPAKVGSAISWSGQDGGLQSGMVGQVRPQKDGSLVYWTEGKDGRWCNVTEQERQLGGSALQEGDETKQDRAPGVRPRCAKP